MNDSKKDLSAFKSLPDLGNHGVLIFDPVWAVSEHLATGAELLYILSGRETLHIGEERYEAEAGDVVVIPPGAPHRDEFDMEKDFSVFMLSYSWSDEAIDLFHRGVRNEKLLALSEASKAEIVDCLDAFREETDDVTEAGRIILNAKLLETLLLIYDLTTGEMDERAAPNPVRNNRGRLLMRRAKEYCAEHFSEPLSLDLISEALEVSPFHLSRVFSAESNFSLFAYLTHLRMEKAKELLLEGNMIVADVAYAVGYSDGNYFSKAFRNYFGDSPSSFLGGKK